PRAAAEGARCVGRRAARVRAALVTATGGANREDGRLPRPAALPGLRSLLSGGSSSVRGVRAQRSEALRAPAHRAARAGGPKLSGGLTKKRGNSCGMGSLRLRVGAWNARAVVTAVHRNDLLVA